MEKSAGQIRFGGALFFAALFKFFAALTVIGGFLAAVAGGIQLNNEGSGDEVIVFVAATWAGTMVTAGFLAFCGYVLEILVEVYEQVFNVRHELAEAADER
jgi:hypothetical protein